jgi:hypothetical protein
MSKKFEKRERKHDTFPRLVLKKMRPQSPIWMGEKEETYKIWLQNMTDWIGDRISLLIRVNYEL